jgi:prepilin-type N-terminal cleavage/methylation domain-containing protein
MSDKREKGVSFIEILIVVAIFSILGVLVGRIILTTLRGSNRSDSLVKVRENLDYSLAVMERQIRNSEGVSPCPNPDTSRVDFRNEEGLVTSFSCVGVGGGSGYIASGSARLTSEEVDINACSFSCSPASGNVQPSVAISLEAQDANVTGIEAAKVTTATTIFLRTY